MISKLSNIWITTDWHLGHQKIKDYCNRPDNYEQLIIDNWLKVVGEGDVVLNLGDLFLSKQTRIAEILNSLPGYKIFIKGNHDRHTLSWYGNNGFDYVAKKYEYKDYLFTHSPWDLTHYPNKHVKCNVHGHFHNNPNSKDNYPFYSPNHVCISIENTNYELVNIKDIELIRIKETYEK